MFMLQKPLGGKVRSKAQMTTIVAHLEGLYNIRGTCERLTVYVPPKAARVARWWVIVL